jgi:hypothetical protein
MSINYLGKNSAIFLIRWYFRLHLQISANIENDFGAVELAMFFKPGWH